MINDYLVVVAGVNAILSEYSDRVEVVEKNAVSKGATAVDVALYDTFAAPVGKHARLASLREDPSIGAVAVYSFASGRAAVDDSLALGANGFLSKALPAADLVRGIEEIAAGSVVTMVGPGHTATGANDWPAKDAGLSAREAEMVGLIVQGLSNREIGDRCYLSANTVKTYIRAAYRKMGVGTRAQAVAWGIDHGLQPDR
ncbi:helix-turn-helix transcriptional regulator [Dietzia sp. JS16-p6b]|uniref:helix-turn-helix transcriptional regulator n=1 Tax=Dietzia sp. SYD-A1 TaxID=2780141 RepID=UPI000D21DBD4|nr:response regulator transcription factor [Dietzia sp. SYD-A1]AVZ41345.1 helix-turn-helix transcriptional regulator [Dietzia sp. JS16-p6b]QGW26285.1 regulatory protein, LuxR [Dietzia sp. DQ12-45-1b]